MQALFRNSHYNSNHLSFHQIYYFFANYITVLKNEVEI